MDVELARQEGTNFRSVRLVSNEQEISIETQDTGPAALWFSGDEDYEFGTHVKVVNFGRLAFCLLRDKYDGVAQATDEFRAFCKTNDIPYEWRSWS